MKKICVVTGTRAEYGLLQWVINGITSSPELHLQLVVTGMHLSPEFGLTINEILSDGLSVDREVEMLLSSDTPTGITKSIGLGVIGFADVISDLAPDLLLILGDRYEILSAAIAAMTARVPIAHLHGGEATEGLIDEAIRHSITKMSHLHFVAAEEYARRVVQLGEQPNRVFNVGGLGIDNIKRLPLLSRSELEASLGIKFLKRNLLITFHPVTLDEASSSQQMGELLSALRELENTQLIFTMPNADTEGRILFKEIEDFVATYKNSIAFTSLGQLKYLSCIRHVDAVLGNSSSGLIEVPSFGKATVNIGDRQKGRLRALSVIDCEPTKKEILNALQTVYSTEFREKVHETTNPYGDGGASEKIIRVLEEVDVSQVLKKSFYDVSVI